jgi:hypothetical protein
LGFAGLLGFDGVVGVVPPELPEEDEDELDSEEELAEPLVVVVLVEPVEADLAFVPGSGVKGLRAEPWCWTAAPLVTSATAVSGVV